MGLSGGDSGEKRRESEMERGKWRNGGKEEESEMVMVFVPTSRGRNRGAGMNARRVQTKRIHCVAFFLFFFFTQRKKRIAELCMIHFISWD